MDRKARGSRLEFRWVSERGDPGTGAPFPRPGASEVFPVDIRHESN
jgi:hypothetical protein